MTALESECSRSTTCAPRRQPSTLWTRLFDACRSEYSLSQTDNGAEFHFNFHWHLEQQDVRHVYIRPKTPRLNGKVERSHRVDEQGLYQLLGKDGSGDDVHLCNDKLRDWKDYYSYQGPHGALDGQTPYERLLARKASAKCYRSPETLH